MKIQKFPSKTLVILDNGHGINTPGKRSPIWSNNTQLFEWKFNRNIVDYIIKYLEVANISYCKLVEEDKDISLQERVNRANSVYYKTKDAYAVYLVSIHGNAAENSNANGVEVWTSKGQTKSDRIAVHFYNQLKNLGWKMRPTNQLKLDREEDFYILKNTICPAVLTENGFYTNEVECAKMNDYYWQKQIALFHFNAIKDIEFGKNKSSIFVV